MPKLRLPTLPQCAFVHLTPESVKDQVTGDLSTQAAEGPELFSIVLVEERAGSMRARFRRTFSCNRACMEAAVSPRLASSR